MKTFRFLSCFLTFALALIASHLGASPILILPAGSEWRYLADGSDQGTAWRAPSFNDTAWSSGPAQLGFGDGDEVTVIPSGAVTAYFRRTFQSQVANPASLTVRLLRDDGAVIYINGVEVFRSNMPPGPVSYNTFASMAVGGAQETTEFVTASIDPGVLVAGANVVAVEVHQVNLTSSDLSFDLELLASTDPPPPVNQRPYVQLNEPQNGDVFTAPTNIVLRAFAHDQEDGYQLSVEFFANTSSLGRGEFVATTCPAPYCPYYQLIWSNAPAGDYTLTARATDSSGASSNSASVNITVRPSDPGTNVTLISMGSFWKYLDNGTDQGTAWRAVSFDDSAWASGPGQLGYGDGDEATVVSFGPDPMNKYITTYFRRSFNVANAAAFSLLRGRLLQDDGGAVYLNGVEIFRSNLPAGPVAFNTQASSVSPENQIVDFSAPASLLINGMNVMAVEMHQVNVTSSDISFDLELLGEHSITPTNEPPYVQLNEPRDADVFTAPTNILLRAYAEDREDGYNLTVEFLVDGQSLGFGTFVPTRCATPYCPYYELTWSNPPPGNFVLRARATDSMGAFSYSAGVNITVRAAPAPGAKLWEFTAGSVYAAPAVAADGTVYIIGGNPAPKLYALTRAGVKKWEVALEGYPTTSLAIGADGTVYVGVNRSLQAYSPNGALLWSHAFPATQMFYNVSSPAIAHDGTIYVGTGDPDKGLYAFRPDGTLKWKFTAGGSFAAVFTPVIGTDGTIYFGAYHDRFYALNPDGTRRWDVLMAGNRISAAVGADGTVYVVGSAGPNKLYAFTPAGAKLWESQIGSELSNESSAPVIGPDGTIYVGCGHDKTMYAFNPDGSAKWTFTADGNVGGTSASPAVDAQGNVYNGFGTQLIAISAAGSRLWSVPMAGMFTAPSLAPDGIIYVGNADDKAYAFQANAGLAQSPWPMFQRDPRHTGAAPLNQPPNERPYVQLNEPQNGDVFTAPTNIVLRAYAQDHEDGYDLTVEFFAGTNRLGVGTFVPTLCPAPYCPYYELTWSNVPPGNYILTARATDSSGASSNSAPVRISVVRSNVVCAPQLEWQRGFGGTGAETLYGIHQTSDGGYLLGGTSASAPSGNKTSPFLGGNQYVGDMWLVRLDAAGNKLWDKSFGGTGSEHLVVVLETRDGGIALAGASDSGISGNKTSPNFGGDDFWLVRLDASGNKLWDRSFGGTQSDFLWRMKETADGGFILGGYSGSSANGNKESPAYGSYADYWIVRVDAAGNKLWDRSFGGESRDELRGLALTPDGGFLLGGISASTNGTRTSQHFGGEDFWVVRVDADGRELWQASFGGSRADQLYDLTATADGGFALGGFSNSSIEGNKTSPNLGPAGTAYPTLDFWIVRLDASGNKLWDRTFGGTADEVLYSIRQMADGGFVAGGYSASQPSGNKTSPAYSSHDFWLVRMDAQGGPLWDVSFGGSNSDPLFALEITSDGGFIAGGQSHSGADGNKTVPSFGFSDYWVVKLGPGRCETNHPPQVRITSPADGAEFDAPAHVRIEAVTSDPDGYASTVEFFANAQKIGEASVVFIQPPPPGQPIHFEFTWTNPPAGQHRLTARTVDNQGARGESSLVNITVREGGPMVGPAPDDQEHPAVASDGVNFLVVWMDRRNDSSEYDIYGARVSASGQVLDPAGIPICTAPGSQWYPSVARDGENYLVIWSDGRTASSLDVYGARVNSSGAVLDASGIQITHGEVVGQPTVAFNGTDYLVTGYTWEHNAIRRTTILGVRVSPSGEVRDHEELILNQSDHVEYPAIVSSVGGDWLVVWNGTGVEGARVSPAGNVTPLATLLNRGFVWINGLVAGSSNYFLTTIDNRQLASDTYVQDIFGTWISGDGRPLRTILIAANTNRTIGSAGGQPTTFKQEHPTAAFNGSDLMVVWDAGDMYYNGGNHMFQSDIRAARVDASGNVSPVISVCDAPQNQSQPAIAFNGQQFLAVWQDARTAPPQEYYPWHHFDIFGARITPLGGVVEHNGFLISGARPNQPPVVAITSPAAGSTFDSDARIFIEATASDPDGEVRSVEFFANGQSIFGRPLEYFYLYWLQPPPGEYILTARATDNAGASSYSEPVNITVRPEPDDNCPPRIQWQVSVGGTGDERLRSIQLTADGGYILGGDSYAGVGGDKSEPGYGYSDYWVVRLDASGDVLWDRTFGGEISDDLSVVRQTADGGFIVAGTAWLGRGGNQEAPSFGAYDMWIIRLDAAGNKLWEKGFGGEGGDSVGDVLETADGGFILGGGSSSWVNGNKSAPNFGGSDAWVVRIDADGNKLWDRSFGGTQGDFLTALAPTADGGFVLAMGSSSGASGNKTTPNFDARLLSSDYWIVRIDADGDKLWENSFGGSGGESPWGVEVTADGGIIVAGYSSSGVDGNKTSPTLGNTDFWVVRTDANGNKLWDRSYGGPGVESFPDFRQTADGGFLLGGPVFEHDGFGALDIVVFRLDSEGNELWQQLFGGSRQEWHSFLAPTADGGYVLGVESDSPVSGNKTSPHLGSLDYWVVKLQPAHPDDCDSDGVPDSRDQCPETGVGVVVDANGCSADQRDTDHDGVRDSRDLCPNTAPDSIVDSNGCSADQRDSDRDGVPDSRDQCPDTEPGLIVDAHGCPLPPQPSPLVGWGCNFYGEIHAPPGLSNVVALAGGLYHTLALKRDGTLVAWGLNEQGQNDIPAEATGIVAIASARRHDLAVRRDGRVIAWGSNQDGQTDVPAGLSDVVAVAAGYSHSLALKADGTVVGWGENFFGQSTPPAGLAGVIAISAGADHSVALKSDGTLVAWGYNAYRQTDIPAGLNDVIAIASGVYQSYALKRDGTVVGWGLNVAPLDGLNNVAAIAAGGDHFIALKRDRTVVSSGYYECDELKPQPDLTNVVLIAAGSDHSLALLDEPVHVTCPCDAPWRNHAEYVNCVIRRAWELFRQGLITRDQRRSMIRDAVQSTCGRRPDRREPVCLHLFPLTREECARDGLQFVLSGDAAGTCVLECSEDLVNWRSVEPVSITGWEITCPLEPGTRARFYRVRVDE